jgi:hypothetical protein
MSEYIPCLLMNDRSTAYLRNATYIITSTPDDGDESLTNARNQHHIDMSDSHFTYLTMILQ